jgi:hypothetical protein
VNKMPRGLLALNHSYRELGIRRLYGSFNTVGICRWCHTRTREKDECANQSSDFHVILPYLFEPTERVRARRHRAWKFAPGGGGWSKLHQFNGERLKLKDVTDDASVMRKRPLWSMHFRPSKFRRPDSAITGNRKAVKRRQLATACQIESKFILMGPPDRS